MTTGRRQIMAAACAAVFGILLIIYLMWAFVLWNLDPGTWSESARAFAVFFFVPVAASVVCATYILPGDAGA